MDEILQASLFEDVGGAFGVTGQHHDGVVLQLLVDLEGVAFTIFLVGRADDQNLGLHLAGGGDTFVQGLEAWVVDDLEAGAGEEVGGEVGTGLAHGEVAVGEHPSHGTLVVLGIDVSGEAQLLELLGGAEGDDGLDLGVGIAAVVGLEDPSLRRELHRLGEVRELVGAQDGLAAGGHVAELLGSALLDEALDHALTDGFEIAAFVLDLVEQVPSGHGQTLGEVLDVVGTCGGVGHLVEVGLFLEDELLVAGDTVGEVGGDLKRRVERHHGEGIHTAEDGRHGTCGGAQHVDIRIVEAHAEFGVGRMDVHLGVLFLASVGLHDVGPQQTIGTQLGQFHEVVLSDGEVEAHLGCNFVDGQTFLGEFVEVLGTHGEAEGHLLDDGGTGVGKHMAVDADGLEVRNLSFHHDVGQLHIGVFSHIPHATAQVTGQGIIVERTLNTWDLGHHLQQRQMIFVVVKVDLHGFLVDTVQKGGNLDGSVSLVVLQLETDAVGTTAEGVEGNLVGFVDIFHGDVLPDEPFIAFGFVTTDVRELGRMLSCPRDVSQVLGTVVRSHLEAFCSAPDQLFVVIRSFEVLLDDGFPFLGAHRWKFFKEFFVVFHILVDLRCYFLSALFESPVFTGDQLRDGPTAQPDRLLDLCAGG